MNKILCFAGPKNSGKNTLCNFLTGYQLKANGIIDSFDITTDGKLYIECSEDEVKGILDLDLYRTNSEFYDWASVSVWPYAKIYAFADPLKEIGVGLFNIPRECLYGTDEQKNQIIEHLRWENMPGIICTKFLEESNLRASYDEWGIDELTQDIFNLGIIVHEPGPMTARQFMQYFGTEIMRKMWGPIWVNALTRTVKAEGSSLSLVSDLRFDNEVDGVRELKTEGYDVKIIKLLGGKKNDEHISEHSLSDKNVDGFLDNENVSIVRTCEILMNQLNDWGWLA